MQKLVMSVLFQEKEAIWINKDMKNNVRQIKARHR